MCGIVGLFIKQPALRVHLGEWLAAMLAEMAERGPDSAGFAVYGDTTPAEHCKLCLLARGEAVDWQELASRLRQELGEVGVLRAHGNHAVLQVASAAAEVRSWLAAHAPALAVIASGSRIEIYKQKGPPQQVIQAFDLGGMHGTHALGHTRMATESDVTVEHSHPFSTGLDLCLVHNGSLSNHNRLRRQLARHGVCFSTDNDSEVAAGYLQWRLAEGADVEQALQAALADLDGFYTFAVGSRDGLAVLRDPIGCKPAVLAETDDWAAMASEFCAIATLPGAEQARIWEPVPGRIYAWSHVGMDAPLGNKAA